MKNLSCYVMFFMVGWGQKQREETVMDKKEKKSPMDIRMDQIRKDINLYMHTMGERELNILYKVAKNLHCDMIKEK